jgi:hypothetical protein
VFHNTLALLLWLLWMGMWMVKCILHISKKKGQNFSSHFPSTHRKKESKVNTYNESKLTKSGKHNACIVVEIVEIVFANGIDHELESKQEIGTCLPKHKM